MTILVARSGRRRRVSERLDLSRVVGLDEAGRIVVDDFDAFNRKPTTRHYTNHKGEKVAYQDTPYLFGLTLCCDAGDKGMADGVGCRGCHGLPGETVSRDDRKVIADAGWYLYQASDGTFPELDPVDHYEDGHGNTIATEGASK